LRTNYVLIDFESVQPESLKLLADDHFKVIVFVGASQTKMPWEVVDTMQRRGKESGQYIKIAGNGPNALDFHIAYYIGRIAVQEPAAYFHIISKDTGFDPLIQHLKSQEIFSARCARIEDIPLLKQTMSKSAEERADLYLEKLRDPKVTKPRAMKTLRSSVLSFFQKQLSEDGLAAVIAAMRASGAVAVENEKISYVLGN